MVSFLSRVGLHWEERGGCGVPVRIKSVPPSHQIRISPEKSEFGAKGVAAWWLINKGIKIDMIDGDK